MAHSPVPGDRPGPEENEAAQASVWCSRRVVHSVTLSSYRQARMHRPPKKTLAPCEQNANPEDTRRAHHLAITEDRPSSDLARARKQAHGAEGRMRCRSRKAEHRSRCLRDSVLHRKWPRAPRCCVRAAGWTAAEAQPGARLPRRWPRGPGEPRLLGAGRNSGTFHPEPFLSLLQGGRGEEGPRQQLPRDRKALRVLFRHSKKRHVLKH